MYDGFLQSDLDEMRSRFEAIIREHNEQEKLREGFHSAVQRALFLEGDFEVEIPEWIL